MSGRGWLRAGAALTAADVAVSAVVWPVRAALDVARVGWRAARLLATPDRPTGWLDGVADPRDRYARALAATGRSDADEGRLLAMFWRRWALFFGLSAVLVAWGTVLASGAAAAWGPLGALVPFVLLPSLVALAAQAAFVHWQVRRRSLDGLGVWLRSPGEWVPPSEIGGGRALASWALVAAALLLTAPTGALAAAAAVGGETADLAVRILQKLLPLGAGASTTTPMMSAVTVLTASLTAVGGGMLCYHVVVGTAATAQEGRVLGQRWNTMWAPLRVAAGFALLAPLPTGSGMSSVHVLLYEVGVQSDRLANNIWATYVDTTLDSAPVALAGYSAVGGETLAGQVLRSETCAAVLLRREAVESGAGTGASTVPAVDPLPPVGGAAAGERQVWAYPAPCNGFSITVTATSAGAGPVAFSDARKAALAGLVTAIRSSGLPGQMSAWQFDGGEFPAAVLPTIQAAGIAYDTAMLSAASALASAQNADVRTRLKAAAKAEGWMSAGAFWRTLAAAQHQVVALASEGPDYRAPTADKGRAPEAAATLARLDDAVQSERGAGALTAADLAAAGQQSDGWLDKILEPVDHRIAQALIDFSAADTSDPTGHMMGLGAKMTAAAQAGTAGSMAVSLLACNGASALTGACQAYETAMGFARPILWACYAAGWLLQFLLPITPWVAMLTLAVGWVMATVEVIVVAPIWAFLLIRMDGQELIDHVQRPGLIIGANWALRPALGVLGLIASFEVLPLALLLLTRGFSTAYVGAQGGHYVGLVGTVGGVLLLSYLSWQFCARVVSLIFQIPDRIPRLFGLPGDGMADAEAHGRGTGAIVGGATSAANNVPTAPPGDGGPGPASKLSNGGGGGDEPISVRPTGGGAGGGAEAHWTQASGGLDSLSDGQRSAAQAAYGQWSEANPEAAARHGLEGYVSYAQAREAQRGQG